ncbi:MAG TPA: PaaI family thioesterase [Candidatus Dormibacteraeota bacterium]|nr:PaaI family thioesterase [Candidatus Dormibacteraeota bacterium]
MKLPSLDRPSAFLQALGMRFEVMEPTRVVGSIDLGPDQHTPWGVVHGGAYTTAIESAASVGASLAVLDRGQFAVGLNNNTDFLRPFVSGQVRIVAEAIHQGATQQLWQVTVSRLDGKIVARGQVRLQNVELPAAEATTPTRPGRGGVTEA